jgi:UDP:flavonoid glycosyltransferase YjiC (YdhE family)
LAVLSDASFQANSRRIGEACRTAGGAQRAADVILAYVEGHHNSKTQ